MEFADNNRYLKNVEIPVTGAILVLAGDTFYLNNTTAPLSKFWHLFNNDIDNYRFNSCQKALAASLLFMLPFVIRHSTQGMLSHLCR